ncbi:hypothetical protein MG293_006559 [Ovis ammon polii]|uniref:Uncharacterized protein n=1 Tax=Ovis ammon polii TaxID=230172 RepID=A0AAD4UGN8_OVIAM|nr:hypothetical protein MG293_006559 [Ovis ammon polii]
MVFPVPRHRRLELRGRSNTLAGDICNVQSSELSQSTWNREQGRMCQEICPLLHGDGKIFGAVNSSSLLQIYRCPSQYISRLPTSRLHILRSALPAKPENWYDRSLFNELEKGKHIFPFRSPRSHGRNILQIKSKEIELSKKFFVVYNSIKEIRTSMKMNLNINDDKGLLSDLLSRLKSHLTVKSSEIHACATAAGA